MPVLCKVQRGDFIESMHVGFVVVVDSKGEIIYREYGYIPVTGF